MVLKFILNLQLYLLRTMEALVKRITLYVEKSLIEGEQFVKKYATYGNQRETSLM